MAMLNTNSTYSISIDGVYAGAIKELELLYKNGLISPKMLRECIGMSEEPYFVTNPDFMFIPQVTEKIDEPIESRFDILDL